VAEVERDVSTRKTERHVVEWTEPILRYGTHGNVRHSKRLRVAAREQNENRAQGVDTQNNSHTLAFSLPNLVNSSSGRLVSLEKRNFSSLVS